ncbi:MAG: SUMF1/EgtB/PvdO family nonheme iron enzyme, partial [Planctomycetales bacterium]|nr:SUMF1/EgtB/PvdO family nonheme iron enzyme [Planctomycetales bacterium]
EWTADDFLLECPSTDHAAQQVGLRSLRGGAFDTYFEKQTTCQTQSADNPLARKHNIGFRCALGLCDVELSAAADACDDAPLDDDAEDFALEEAS